MDIVNKTILITGGGSGIGFEIAKAFATQGNQVIISGRDIKKLERAASFSENIVPIPCDVNRKEDIDHLLETLRHERLQVDILVNNAGKAYAYRLDTELAGYEKAKDEMSTNYFANIVLTETFLPLLHMRPEAAIVNVSSIVSFVPAIAVPTYSASKAALHSFTQSLRLSLHGRTNIKVFELMPPVVDTEFSRELPAKDKFPPAAVAEVLIRALQEDEFEIHVGSTRYLYGLYLQSPALALAAMNGLRV